MLLKHAPELARGAHDPTTTKKMKAKMTGFTGERFSFAFCMTEIFIYLIGYCVPQRQSSAAAKCMHHLMVVDCFLSELEEF